MRVVFLVAACVSILAVLTISIFLFANGIPAMSEIGIFDFLLGKTWRPSNGIYGIFPMILGSLYVTAGAIIIGVPIGVLTAVFMAKFCPPKIYRVLKPAVNLLAGIPSVVYGFFGLVVIVPMIRDVFAGARGKSLLAASILLGIMILPTIISVSEASIRAVRTATMRPGAPSAPAMNAAYSSLCFPRQSPGSCRALCWASAAPSARQWPLLWSRATRPSFPTASCRACGP